MATIVDRGDLLFQEILNGLRDSSVTSSLAIVGGVGVTYVAGRFMLNVLNGIRIHFWSRLFPVDFKTKFGPWAVVTGCTSGIGRSMSLELARRGCNVVLISRNQDLLDKLAQFIQTEYKVQTFIVVADFKDPGIYEGIKDKLNPLMDKIGVLVNNVGMIHDHLDVISNNPDCYVQNCINVNVISVTRMSKMVLEAMEKRKKGAIINVSSTGGRLPMPYMTVYSATKAFVNHFSRCIRFEYGARGIIVQNLIPMSVNTKMIRSIINRDQIRSSILNPDPDVYAYNALSTFGRTNETTGYWGHSLCSWLIDVLPRSLIEMISFSEMKRAARSKKK